MSNEQLSTFGGGMNLDLSDDKLPKDKYSFAENFRHTVSNGNTIGTLEAINGNKPISEYTTPGCVRYSIFKKSTIDKVIDLGIKTTDGYVLNFDLEITDHSLPISELLSLISIKINEVIYDAENDVIPMPAGIIKFISSGNNFVIYGDIDEITEFTNDNGGVRCIFSTENSIVSNYVGFTKVRDKTLAYVITEAGYNALLLIEEDAALQEASTVISCKYIGDLNLDLEYPIIDSVINYESNVFCKVYFTDNKNPLRSVNIFQNELMTKDGSFFDLIQNISLGNIKVNSIINESSLHKCGRIQYAFQYYNTSGQESTFSNPCSMVDLAYGSLSGPNMDYIGGDIDNNVNKKVKIKLFNLDVSFERIRIVSIFYSGYNSEAVIKIIYEDLIPSSGVIEYIDGNNNGEILTTESLTVAGSKLVVCKTLDVKNNLLLISNIKDSYEDFSGYDMRAYRFDIEEVVPTATLFDTEELTFTYPELETINIELTKDCKLPKLEQFKYSYGKNLATDSWMKGGCGKGISYNFVRVPVLAGAVYNQSNIVSNDTVYLEAYLGDQYSNDTLYSDMTSPIKSGSITGYMRNEVYRFGIVFYDLKGRKNFTTWIGDIKFPAMSEVDTTYVEIDGTQIYDYRTSFTDSFLQNWLIQLGIEFHIDSSVLPLNISGYSIVRMERTNADKTELAQGLISGEVQDVRYGEEGALTPKASYFIPFGKNGEEDSTFSGIDGRLKYLESGKLKQFISPEISYNVISPSNINSKTLNLMGFYARATTTTEVATGQYHDPLTPQSTTPSPFHTYAGFGHQNILDYYSNNLDLLSESINLSDLIDVPPGLFLSSKTIGLDSFNYGVQKVELPTGYTQTGNVIYKGVPGNVYLLIQQHSIYPQ